MPFLSCRGGGIHAFSFLSRGEGGAFKVHVVCYSSWKKNFESLILAASQIGGQIFSAVWRDLKNLFKSQFQRLGIYEADSRKRS